MKSVIIFPHPQVILISFFCEKRNFIQTYVNYDIIFSIIICKITTKNLLIYYIFYNI